MFNSQDINKKIPSYYILRIFFTGLLMYLVMVFSVSVFIIIKSTPAIISSITAQLSPELKEAIKEASVKRIVNKTLPNPIEYEVEILNENNLTIQPKYPFDFLTLYITVLGLLTTIVFNMPILLYFEYKKRKKITPEKCINYTRRFLRKTPVINTMIIFTSLCLLGLFKIRFFFKSSQLDENIRSLYLYVIIIAFIAGALWMLFAFFWQRSRVQRLYIDEVFTKEELKIRTNSTFHLSVFFRFIAASFMTTIFPLVSVLFYVIFSFSIIDTSTELSYDQLKLLMGEISNIFDSLGISDVVYSSLCTDIMNGNSTMPLLYINSINSLQMITGIILGLMFSIIYVSLFIRWSTMDIVLPIKDLLVKIKRIQNGDLESFTTVRSNDEIGELCEGYNTMVQGLQEREKIKNLFGQYLTKEISDEILKGTVNLDGELYEATVMFCDIRDFTSMSEKIPPDEVFKFLNSYLNRMIDVILKHGGIIDKFIGDGILAIFGVPVRSETHATFAVKASFAMEEALKELNKERKAENLIPIKIGIGLHTGNLIAGNIGNYKKLEYTVIGDTVNIASRIEKMTKDFSTSIVMTETTFSQLSADNPFIGYFESVHDVPIRGKNQRFNIYKKIIKE